MHNLAISLQKAGHLVTGSDDEIYEPARGRLEQYSLLPAKEGWNVKRIHKNLDLVIIGMHARKDNPELQKALDQGLKVMSFPAFMYDHSKDKKRIVVAGSHGKTTTTSMILHVLKHESRKFDYLVGAQIDGFETMVGLSDAPIAIMEGDEYLSSPLDPSPKIWHYRPQICVITGIAWDHMNVFPTFEAYLEAFSGFLERSPDGATIIYYESDLQLVKLVGNHAGRLSLKPYRAFDHQVEEGRTSILLDGTWLPLQVFGHHNMENLRAAYLVLKTLGITDKGFAKAIISFKGAAKRMQILQEKASSIHYQDFAHAPSKVKASVNAVKTQFPDRRLTACVELHTYSSLNKEFLPQYNGALDNADVAAVYFSHHTLEMKKLPMLSKEDILKAFGREDLQVYTQSGELETFLREQNWHDHNLLMMSSGTFGGINLKSL